MDRSPNRSPAYIEPLVHLTVVGTQHIGIRTSDMPAAAFVAGAAIQNAHNASLIAQQAATVAEQQTLEANQARHYASFVEAQATQALQQAEATLLETRAKAEAYVAQAEANVRNTQTTSSGLCRLR